VGGKTERWRQNTDAGSFRDPDITVGVWIGFDDKRVVGAAEAGSLAAPGWDEFMQGYIDGRPTRKDPPDSAPATRVPARRPEDGNGVTGNAGPS
jgi:penicillin-binding protein 1A